MTAASDADLNHLFGIKKPFLAPLHLSIPLHAPRQLTPDEAAQICERDSAIKPTTRDNWELSPVSINGLLHAALSKMSNRGGRHAESTWQLPTAGVGQLRLSSPLGSGRALTKDECRQLRSIDDRFAGANPAWTVKPSPSNLLKVDIVRYQKMNMLPVGQISLAPLPPPQSASARPKGRIPHSRLSARSQAWLSAVF
ncbi:MAG: hypothetical protein FD131_4598 [Rhodocyclaceae bacterium]|nr:MAG: hypothetical protein FD131_4598 [Rhodocyclaceae bacterium]